MEFGINFFPTHSTRDKPQAQYYAECVKLIGLCDALGYSHVRTVEHYFMPYGASPNPIIFLTAAAQHTKRAKLITGAVLPVFNNPLKLAGEIAMLDALSNGRVEVGFARAFLPHEFDAFDVSLDDSRARFNEGLAQVGALLERENVTMEGRFHSFKNITSLPRPTQKPRPPFWVAAFTTEDSFREAGTRGDWMMCIPTAGPQMAKLIGAYRDGWRAAGHPGQGRVMLAHHMYCAPTRDEVADAKEPLNLYLAALMECMEGWAKGRSTKDYPGYDKAVEFLRRDNFDNMRERGIAWCGTPDEIADMIASYYDPIPGGVEVASIQVNFHTLPVEKAERSMRLFAEKVMPKFGAIRPSSAVANATPERAARLAPNAGEGSGMTRRFKPIVKRDTEVHLTFLGDWGVANWHGAVGLLAAGLQWRTNGKSTFTIQCLTPKWRDSLEAVYNRDVDVCVSTPVSTVFQAREGLGPFTGKHPELVTFARMAHRDRLILALAKDVCAKYSVWTFADIAAKKPPLRIVNAVHDGMNSISWTSERIINCYGVAWDDIPAWGGEWIATARPHDGIARLMDGTADGLFFEAVMNWHRLIERRPLHFFAMDDFVLDALKTKYGMDRNIVPAGEFAGIDVATPVVEFGDWIFAIRRDMPDETAYLLAETIVDDLEQFVGRYRGRPLKESPLDYSVGPEYLCRTGPVPLHPGAERFYRERGLL